MFYEHRNIKIDPYLYMSYIRDTQKQFIIGFREDNVLCVRNKFCPEKNNACLLKTNLIFCVVHKCFAISIRFFPCHKDLLMCMHLCMYLYIIYIFFLSCHIICICHAGKIYLSNRFNKKCLKLMGGLKSFPFTLGKKE